MEQKEFDVHPLKQASRRTAAAQKAERAEQTVVERPRYLLPLVLVYSVVVLSVALWGSLRLYDWALNRIVQGSSVSAVQATLDHQTQPQANNQPAQAVAPASGEQPAAQATAAPLLPAINVLVLGTDERADDTAAPRTDTMILLTLDPNTLTAGMLSFPRDLWVSIPETGVTNKINMAYMIGEQRGYAGGGAQLAKNTVSAFIGQPVQYYVHVNFTGFIEAVDLIDGIDVVVPKTIDDDQYPTPNYGVETFHIDAGPQHLDGATALKYARTRHEDSDYGRARRQQDIIRAVSDKVLRADMIPTLLPKLPQLLATTRNSIDTDIPLTTLFDLAKLLQKTNLHEIRQLVLDNEYGTEDPNGPEGAWILLPDRAKVRDALTAFFSPALRNPSGAVAIANPSWVRVQVLNGTDQPGVAARTRDLLQAKGWHVVSIGDADRDDYGRTIIINYGVPQPLVDKVSNALGLQPNLSSLNGMQSTVPVDVRIVVGKDILSKVK